MAAPTRDETQRRPDASMSLLTNLMANSLDEGYAEAAARRTGAAEGSRWRPSWTLGVGLVAVGALLATAAAQVRDRAPAAAEVRTALATEVDRRTAANDRLEADLDRVRASVAGARRDALALTSEGSRLSEQLATLEAVTGATAVSGPALVVHLEDAAGSDEAAGAPRDATDSSEGRVADRDLQTVVNEIWAVGAEAVAISDQRLTSLSAIRSAGEAILVDFRPLSPPYDVVGIGDADAMRTSFSEGFGGSYLQVLRQYGISFSIRTRDDERLPASAGLDVRYARAAAGDGGGSVGSP